MSIETPRNALPRIQQALSTQVPRSAEPLSASNSSAIQASLEYLSSDEAKASLEADPYWPKWDSPWWHMAVLHEMGIADRIPPVAVQRMVASIRRQYVPYFFTADVPKERDPVRDTHCHCSLGNIFQILSAAGTDLDVAVPWARSWFMRYQMTDGGLNCDEAAYKAHTPASSMVGTIAPLEAVLFHTKRPFTKEEETFLDLGAQCLLDRKLMLACSAPHNVEEQEDEAGWLRLCFPRFYFYDILRGLHFVLRWADARRNPIPAEAISDVVEILCNKFQEGLVRVERHSFDSVGTRIPRDSGEWSRSDLASTFPLMLELSRPGEVSPHLTEQWTQAKALLSKLIQEGLIR